MAALVVTGSSAFVVFENSSSGAMSSVTRVNQLAHVAISVSTKASTFQVPTTRHATTPDTTRPPTASPSIPVLTHSTAQVAATSVGHDTRDSTATKTTSQVAATASASATSSIPAISAASRALMSHLNPSANIAPTPNFLQSGQCVSGSNGWSCANPCVSNNMTWPTYTNDPTCTNYILGAINVGRQTEGLAPMALPSNWYTLNVTEQLFVMADLERTARGLAPYLGLNAVLSASAQHAAQSNSDPGAASGFAMATDLQGYPAMGGTWSSGISVLAADYFWMYSDGWGGSSSMTSNIACTSATSTGCWAHRDELLGYDPNFNPGVGLDCATAQMGAGFAVVNGSSSFVDLIEIPRGKVPPMTFTWAQNVVPYL